MTSSNSEPFAAFRTMDELLGTAWLMEQEAIAEYSALAERMVQENRPELATVFERLIQEETQHLDNVAEWARRSGAGDIQRAAKRSAHGDTFDDEGIHAVAPQMLTAYRAFSMAVRNEERAFVFWTYVAANAPSAELREAAEQMAREELGHVATLRRERRRAFHQQRITDDAPHEDKALDRLEMRLADDLRAMGTHFPQTRRTLEKLAGQAQQRASENRADAFALPAIMRNTPVKADASAVSLCELLLDSYLEIAERSSSEDLQLRAQRCASQLVECLSFMRGLA
ncbi:MAG: ferritin-like domain-containing protein [Phyllobacterium sp.]